MVRRRNRIIVCSRKGEKDKKGSGQKKKQVSCLQQTWGKGQTREWLEEKIGWMFVANNKKMIKKGVVKRISKIVDCIRHGKRIEKGMVRRKSRINVYNRQGKGYNHETRSRGVEVG